jgi:hypothetical protein
MFSDDLGFFFIWVDLKFCQPRRKKYKKHLIRVKYAMNVPCERKMNIMNIFSYYMFGKNIKFHLEFVEFYPSLYNQLYKFKY